jgi:hypothetical protein
MGGPSVAMIIFLYTEYQSPLIEFTLDLVKFAYQQQF